MKTTLNLSDDLVRKQLRVSGIDNKTKAIETAIREYLEKLKRDNILNACGKLEIEFDVERFRESESHE